MKRIILTLLLMTLLSSQVSAFHKTLNDSLIQEAIDYGTKYKEIDIVKFTEPWLFRGEGRGRKGEFCMVGTKWFAIALLSRLDYLYTKIQLMKDLKIKGIPDKDIFAKLDRLVQVLDKYTGGDSIDKMEKALKNAGVEVRDLTTDYKEQQRLISVLTAAKDLLFYDILEKADKAHSRAEEKVESFMAELMESMQTTTRVKLVTPVPSAPSYEVLDEGNIALYTLYMQLKESGKYFQEHNTLLRQGKKVMIDFPMILDEVSTEDLTEAVIKISGGFEEFDKAEVGANLNITWFAIALLSQYDAFDIDKLAQDDNFQLIFTLDVSGNRKGFADDISSIIKIDKMIIQPAMKINPDFATTDSRLWPNAPRYIANCYHMYDVKGLPDDATIQFVIIYDDGKESIYKIDLSKIK